MSFHRIQIYSMESWRQRGLTAGKCHKIAWQTYNSVEEGGKKRERTVFQFQITQTKINI